MDSFMILPPEIKKSRVVSRSSADPQWRPCHNPHSGSELSGSFLFGLSRSQLFLFHTLLLFLFHLLFQKEPSSFPGHTVHL
jgi:hypothetical protein